MTSRQFWMTVLAVIVAQMAGGALAYLVTQKLIRGGGRGAVSAQG